MIGVKSEKERKARKMDRKTRDILFYIYFPTTKNVFYKYGKSAPGYLVTFVVVPDLFFMYCFQISV